MDKGHFLKARVTEKTKVDFEDICRAIGAQPTTKLREIIETFVEREYQALDDRLVVHISRPDGYDFGAWRATMRLRDPEALEWEGVSVPFRLPDLPKRRVHSDREYLAVVGRPGGQELMLGGQFVKGEWRGNIYSNGVAEVENPTSTDVVRDELIKIITGLLDRFSAHCNG